MKMFNVKCELGYRHSIHDTKNTISSYYQPKMSPPNWLRKTKRMNQLNQTPYLVRLLRIRSSEDSLIVRINLLLRQALPEPFAWDTYAPTGRRSSIKLPTYLPTHLIYFSLCNSARFPN